jgi:hypothetical protein
VAPLSAAADRPCTRRRWCSSAPLLEIVVVAIFIVTFVVQPFRIPSESMQPTLFVGDFGMADKQAFARGPLARLLPPARCSAAT